MLLGMIDRYEYLYLVSFVCLKYQLYGPVVSEVVIQLNVSQCLGSIPRLVLLGVQWEDKPSGE